MKYWLVKSEPQSYSIDDLKKDKKTSWNGVRNYQARNFMRDSMQIGDGVLFYHSSAEPPGVAGAAKICRAGYLESKPQWYMVDVAFEEKFRHFVSLEQIKASASLKDMLVVKRGMRLSVQPVEKKDFELVCQMGRG